LAPLPVSCAVFKMGMAMSRLDSSHRDTVVDLFRVINPVVVPPPA
jgi:hypothetical protein